MSRKLLVMRARSGEPIFFGKPINLLRPMGVWVAYQNI